jgi:hypothetical protein
MKFYGILSSVLASTLLFSCSPQVQKTATVDLNNTAHFYSSAGTEAEVQFTAVYKTSDYSLDDIKKMDTYSKASIERNNIKSAIKYLFGPLTNRELAGMHTEMVLSIAWDQAYAEKNQVVIPYQYKGTWLVSDKISKSTTKVTLPLPFNTNNLITKEWLSCTDSSPEHQTESFFWYFWDPTRSGCDHKLGEQYQMIDLVIGSQTVQTKETFPEYQKMLNSNGVKNNFSMTFGFGYVEDEKDANPDKDSDYGMGQYRKFIAKMDSDIATTKFVKSAILQKEYLNAQYPEKVIGYRYAGVLNNVNVEIKVVTSANIDQMELFAKSYAHDHDGFFSWFGHSRVGSGFDAENFASMLRYNPNFYSLSNQYQLIYWAGCNSYSYYALPFFKQKAQLSQKLNPNSDVNGTKNLDIIANGLPSQFSFNADNAIIMYNALLNWNKPTSYQSLVNKIEKRAARSYSLVLVNILGDEDNSL